MTPIRYSRRSNAATSIHSRGHDVGETDFLYDGPNSMPPIEQVTVLLEFTDARGPRWRVRNEDQPERVLPGQPSEIEAPQRDFHYCRVDSNRSRGDRCSACDCWPAQLTLG